MKSTNGTFMYHLWNTTYDMDTGTIRLSELIDIQNKLSCHIRVNLKQRAHLCVVDVCERKTHEIRITVPQKLSKRNRNLKKILIFTYFRTYLIIINTHYIFWRRISTSSLEQIEITFLSELMTFLISRDTNDWYKKLNNMHKNNIFRWDTRKVSCTGDTRCNLRRKDSACDVAAIRITVLEIRQRYLINLNIYSLL